MAKDKAWKDYEEVAVYLLDQIASELGLERVEGKQGSMVRAQEPVGRSTARV